MAMHISRYGEGPGRLGTGEATKLMERAAIIFFSGDDSSHYMLVYTISHVYQTFFYFVVFFGFTADSWYNL